jgi:hypothetical protein
MVALMVSCNQSGPKGESDSQVAVQDNTVTTTVEEMLAQPAEFVDKEVAFSGMVTHVCRHGGQKCFVVGKDGETQIRIVPGDDIDEFKVDLEGSTVAFQGTFNVLNAVQSLEHNDDYNSKEHHITEMAHSEAEKADYFIVAAQFREITQ